MTNEPTLQSIVLGGGCFWCLEAAYQEIAGVTEIVSGYAGGKFPNPTYERIESGTTGHAQVVKLSFDINVIKLEDILEIFWAIHDPTTMNRQMHDVGTQYRSIILYQNEQQHATAEKSKAEVQKLWDNPVITEIAPLEIFYPAEEYHQNYFRTHPEQAYCQIIINPKLHKLREKFHARLKAV